MKEMTSSESGPESHILNFYEDLDMPLCLFKEAIANLLEAKVENVEEKMDGQNLTFTVRNGEVETFSKGTSWKTVQNGGKKIADYDQKYADNPSVRDAFKKAYYSLQSVVDNNSVLSSALFQNGNVVIESLLMLPENPNTIVYDKPTIRFVKAYQMNPDGQEVDKSAYAKFVKAASLEKTPVQIGEVPILKLKKIVNSDEILAELSSELNALMKKANVNKDDTMGDLIAGLIQKNLENEGLSPAVARKISIRLGKKQKSAFSQKDAKIAGPNIWKKVQEMENSPYVDEAIIPIERILQKLAFQVFRNVEFVLSLNSQSSGESLRNFVKKTKSAMKNGRIIADPKQLEAIRVALERIGDESLFEKAVEGIVFRWNGKTRKLTGLFTSINKLRGFFAYGKTPAKFIDETK